MKNNFGREKGALMDGHGRARGDSQRVNMSQKVGRPTPRHFFLFVPLFLRSKHVSPILS